MNFLLPSALLALVAIVLPVLIHLSKRSEPQRTDFAALRWLRARFVPQRQPVVQEWWLLLVRILLLSALVFLLARPFIQRESSIKQWWLLTPGLDASSLPNATDDKTIERRWLASGFPLLTEASSPSSSRASPISLVRELDATLPSHTRIRVWLPEHLDGLDSARLQLSRRIDWQIVKNTAATKSTAPFSQLPLPRWHSSAVSEKDRRLAYFRAAFLYWQQEEASPQRLAYSKTDLPPPLGTTWLRISDQPLSEEILAWVRASGQLLLMPGVATPKSEAQVLWRDETGAPILVARAYGQGRILQFQQAFNVENMPILERAAFAEHLRAELEVLPAPQRAMAVSHQPHIGLPAWSPIAQSLKPWIVWFILALFALERFLATRPMRQVRA